VSLADNEKQGIRALMAALEPFFEIRGDMPAQYIAAFLHVAMDEGKGVSTYAERAGVSKSVMSRHLHDIGDADRAGKEGFGLVEHRPHPVELRIVEVYLTTKGRALAHRILRAASQAFRGTWTCNGSEAPTNAADAAVAGSYIVTVYEDQRVIARERVEHAIDKTDAILLASVRQQPRQILSLPSSARSGRFSSASRLGLFGASTGMSAARLAVTDRGLAMPPGSRRTRNIASGGKK
jgi:DNA-binding MarR family transcriptional regulator